MAAGRRPKRPIRDAVDVPENEPVDQVPDLKTETTIAALALLAGRLFRRRATAVARSYNELRAGPAFGSTNDLIDQWVRQQTAILIQECQAGIVRPLTERYRQFEAQLGRQIDAQLKAVGVEVAPQNSFGVGVGAALAVSPIARSNAARRSAKAIEQSAKLVADQVTRKVQALLEQVDTAVTQAALHNPTELPVIDFKPKVKAATSAVQRAAVDVTWTYQTATQAIRYEEAGVQYATWVTQGDGRVRPSHRMKNGRVYKMSEGLEGTWPGAEINCRCYPVPKRPGYRPRTSSAT